MQNELQSLDPSNVNYKQSTQEIVAKYCEYFNEYEKQRSNSDHAFESLTQWMDRSETEEKIIIGYWMEETYLDSWLIIVMFILHR